MINIIPEKYKAKEAVMHEENVVLELLKSRFVAQQELCSDYGKGCMGWLLILGFILKYSYDPQIQDETQVTLRYGAIFFSLVGIVLNVRIFKVMKGLDEDIETLSRKLNTGLLYLSTKKLEAVIIVSALFDILVIIMVILNMKPC